MDKRKKILIVEDEALLMEALFNRLSAESFDLLKASNGQEGADIALKEHPDLMLVDLILPKLDGISLIKKIRGDSWGSSVPIIVLTNLTDSEKMNESIQYHVTDYLIKTNWKLEEVVKKVKDTLAKGK